MLVWLVGIYTFYIFIKIYLSVMQIGYINQEKYKDAVILPEGKYLVAGNYAVAKEKLSIINSFVGYLLFLWWLFSGFEMLQRFFGVDGFISSILFIFGFFAIDFLVSLPFSIYKKFKIDSDFGFNKMSPKMFVVDTLKSIALFLIFGGVIFSLLIWIIESFSLWWFGVLYCFLRLYYL